jgi:hypothetical protein
LFTAHPYVRSIFNIFATYNISHRFSPSFYENKGTELLTLAARQMRSIVCQLYDYHYLYDKNVMLTKLEGENNNDANETKVAAY